MMFSLYARLAAAAVVAVFLAGVYWKGHTSGAKSVQALWDADVAQRTAAALEASEAARKVEQELRAKNDTLRAKYAAKVNDVRTVANAAASGLRNLEAILTAPAAASSSAAASSGNHGTGGIERELLGQCAAALARMGAEADRLSIKVVTLQEYIKATR